MKLDNGNITTNFTLQEIACNDTDQSIIINGSVLGHVYNLQEFRTWYNRPMTVTSWYRTTEYNSQIGGASASKHLQGIATDILLPSDFSGYTNTRKRQFIDNCQSKWHEICDNSGGFGIYDSFMHFDSRNTKIDFDYRSDKSW